MKKQYLRISLAAFFIAALTFSTSCSKKSSDDPKPATTPTTPVATSSKPAAPNTSNKSTANQTEDGTLRVPTTATPVGSVTVLDQDQQRSQMTSGNTTKLDNLTGKGTTQGRMESGTTDFGWFVSDMTVDGKAYTDQDITDNGFDAVLFFNIDVSGYYWQYQISTKQWAWGTYGIDANMSTIAFDFNDNLVANEVWEITKLTNDRLVVKGKINIVRQSETDTTREVVIIGLNGYDLTNNEYNGQTDVDPAEKVFLGKWINLDANSLPAKPLTNLFLNEDGTYSLEKTGTETSYGSWVLEEDLDNVYLYASYYDAKLNDNEGGVAVDMYKITIVNNIMDMLLVDTTNPENEIYIDYTYRFGR